MFEDKLIELLKRHDNLERDLELAKSLNIPQWYIAAGYVRNKVWDYLHGYSKPTPLNDIDVIFYDQHNLCEAFEKELESELNSKTNMTNWSVKNQARMHLKNNDEPYQSVHDALSRWVETATPIGITLNENGNIGCIAPHGYDDLFQMKIRRSPLFKDKYAYQERVKRKNWTEIWPMLEVVWD